MAKKPMTEEEALAAARALTERENKKVRKRPDSTVQAEPGDNSKYTRHNLELFKLTPLTLDDPAETAERTATYFEICDRNDMKPSVAGYALALGIDRRRLWEIVAGKIVKPDGVTDVLKRAYLLLNAQLEDYMQNGKVNPVTGIFLTKNHFGYQDKQEITVSANQEATESPEQIEQKIRDAIPADFAVNEDETGAES